MKSCLNPILGLKLRIETENPFLPKEFNVLDGFFNETGVYLICRAETTPEWPEFDSTAKIDLSNDTLAFIDIEKGPYMDEEQLKKFKLMNPFHRFAIGKQRFEKMSLNSIRETVRDVIFKVA